VVTPVRDPIAVQIAHLPATAAIPEKVRSTNMRERRTFLLSRTVLVGLCLLVAGQSSLLFGQYGRASITGIVHDATGAVVPNASVTAVNTQTQVRSETTTNEAGNYRIELPIGDYSLTFSSSGFKELTRSGLTLTSGQVARIDVSLEVGQVTERLSIRAEAPILETETAHAAGSVDAEIFAALPLNFGSAGRNMVEFASKLLPGVRGTDWSFSMEGTPGGSASVVIDGQSNLNGWIPGDFQEQSISPESIQEMTVVSGNMSADLGNTAGGTVNFVLKSGTNQLHGSALYYLRNEILNANDWNNNRMLAADPNFTNPTTATFKRPVNRRHNVAGSIGGPVYIPGLYNGKDKTFFYVTIERFWRDAVGPATLARTVPQLEMWDGDLSRLLGKVVATDPLGRPVAQGQLYDPNTLRQVAGSFVADPFTGNIIPSQRISKVARNFQSIFKEYYPPVTADLANNLYTTNRGWQHIQQDTIKGDHAFSTQHKVSGFIYITSQPRINSPNDGIWSLKDPVLGGPMSEQWKQYRHGWTWNVSHDWMISPVVLNHLSVGRNTAWSEATDFHRLGELSTINYPEQWGIKGVGGGLPVSQITRPYINLGTSPVVTYTTWGGSRDGPNQQEFYRTLQVNDTLSKIRGAHSLKFGFEYVGTLGDYFKYGATGGNFNFAARTTGIPGQSYTAQTGNSYASFLLGAVDSANMGVPWLPTASRSYAGAYAQDAWKVTPKLTLNLGLRWNGNSAFTEGNDEWANFSPTLPDPNANNLPGAVEYMGSGPGRAGKRSPGGGDWFDLGPTFGFAYRFMARSVVRGGYSVTYTPESIGTAAAFGFLPNAYVAGFKQTNTVQADSKGLYLPVFNMDAGYPGVTSAVSLDPSWGQKNPSTMISPDFAKPGYIQHFNLNVQTEVARNLVVEVGWRGTKGTAYHNSAIVRPNQIRKEELSRGAVLGQVIDSPAKASAAGLPYPYAGWSGLGANTLMPYPQITTQALTGWGYPVGFSTYHSGNLIVTKRMSSGFMLYGAYTLSKLIGNSADLIQQGAGFSQQDSYDRTKYKSVNSNDRTHVIKASMVWSPPLGRGRALLSNANRVVNAMVANWEVSAILNYSSGAPLSAPASRRTPVGWNGGTVVADFNTPADGFNKVFNPDTFNPWNANDPGNRFFNPAAFSDSATQQLGTSPSIFPTVRMLWGWNEDVSILKRFSITERVRLQLRMEFLNALNRHSFAGPDTNLNNSYFGNIRTASGSRNGQFGLRLEW
jgi:hypothetical protein